MNADAAVARRLAAGLYFLKTGGQRPPLQLEVTPASCWLCSAAIMAAVEETKAGKACPEPIRSSSNRSERSEEAHGKLREGMPALQKLYFQYGIFARGTKPP